MPKTIPGILKNMSYLVFAVLTLVAGLPLNSVLAAQAALRVTTMPATYVDSTDGVRYAATVNGSLSGLDSGTSAAVHFELGVSANYTRSTTPTAMTAGGSFSAVFGTGESNDPYLSANTTYHFRAVATAGNTTVSGSDLTFVTTPYPAPPGQIVQQQTLTQGHDMYTANLNQPGFVLFHTEFYAPNGIIQEITGTDLTLSPW
jgi:hypothetical protein